MGDIWTRHERIEVLRIATNLTSLCHEPKHVMRHTAVLTEWLDEAAAEGDRKDRLAALLRADACRARSQASAPRDDPEQLIAEAQTYYGYLKGA
jgi:hypothetical protein